MSTHPTSTHPTSTRPTSAHPARRTAAAAAAGFLTIAAFEVALAAGAPLGRAAWGGSHTHLPAGLRIASAVAVGVWLFAALIVLGRGGFRVGPLPPKFLRWATWTLVGVQLLAALTNFASSSSWERYLWGPVALIMAGLCLVVARGAAPEPHAGRAATPTDDTTSRPRTNR